MKSPGYGAAPDESGLRTPFTGWELRSRGTLCPGGAGWRVFFGRFSLA